jgi:hypothetical protein
VLNSRAVHQGQPRIKRGLCLALVDALELISAADWNILISLLNKKKRETGGQGEFSVGLAARRDASPMSRHNQPRSVEEGSSLLGGTHAMKIVKPRVDILEGLSTGVNMGVSAPHLIHKWLNESRQSPSFMLGGLG